MGLICFLISSQQIVENHTKTKDLEGSPALNSCDVTSSRPFNFCVSSQTCPKHVMKKNITESLSFTQQKRLFNSY